MNRFRNQFYKEIGGLHMHTAAVKPGSKIKFAEEKQSYTVRASNAVFAVCTKPMNAKKTVLYSVVDWINNVRGTENLVFGAGAETDEQCRSMLARLTAGETEISHRNCIPLVVETVKLNSLKPNDDDIHPIPIDAAKHIAEEYGYDQVMIFARRVGESPDPHGEHMTTYGVDKVHCDIAARVGEFLKTKIMGWYKENDAK